MRKRLCAVAIFYMLVPVIVSISADAVAKSDRDILIAKYDERIMNMVGEWEESNEVILDSRMASELAGEVVHWRAVFGFNYEGDIAPNKAILESLDNELWLKNHIFRYLDDLIKSPEKVRTLFSRLSVEIGHSASQAGWPDEVMNRYVVADYRAEIPDRSYKLISEGKSTKSYRKYRVFIVGVGEHEIISSEGARLGFTVDPPEK